MKIAIIGTGISGLGVAHYLARHHDITVYDREAVPGGHARTVTITIGGTRIDVDTGFIVFNDRNYPCLLRLFDELGVPYEKSDMSFGARVDDEGLEYASGNLLALRNIIRPSYVKMLVDIFRFNRKAPGLMDVAPSVTLGEFLDGLGMGRWFRDYHLLAIGAAIWSCPAGRMADFPARSFLRFFHNHGLLGLRGRPQWYTVSGGSRVYIERLIEPFGNRIKSGCGIRQVKKRGQKWHLTDTNGEARIYDAVVFACPADEALRILHAPPGNIREVLGAFAYEKNAIIVHSDTGFMPKNPKCWASWVYLSEKHDKISMSYWMNNLQSLATDTPVIVTLNPARRPVENLIHDECIFFHPVYNEAAITAQKRIEGIQGRENLWFCGAYHGYGFHEDGLVSALNMLRTMGVTVP